MRLKTWQKIFIAIVFFVYATTATFQVYGGFYIGFPPYTPALLNNTRQSIVRQLSPSKPSLLTLIGAVRNGRVRVLLNNKESAVLVGSFQRQLPLPVGHYKLVIENQESSGWMNYNLR